MKKQYIAPLVETSQTEVSQMMALSIPVDNSQTTTDQWTKEEKDWEDIWK